MSADVGSGGTNLKGGNMMLSPIFFTSMVNRDVYENLFIQFIALLEPHEQDRLFQQDSEKLHT